MSLDLKEDGGVNDTFSNIHCSTMVLVFILLCIECMHTNYEGFSKSFGLDSSSCVFHIMTVIRHVAYIIFSHLFL